MCHCVYEPEAALTAGTNNQPVPEDKQAQFQQSYTVLVAFLTVILPPIITQGVDDVSSTDQEVALSKCAPCNLQCKLVNSITLGFLEVIHVWEGERGTEVGGLMFLQLLSLAAIDKPKGGLTVSYAGLTQRMQCHSLACSPLCNTPRRCWLCY